MVFTTSFKITGRKGRKTLMDVSRWVSLRAMTSRPVSHYVSIYSLFRSTRPRHSAEQQSCLISRSIYKKPWNVFAHVAPDSRAQRFDNPKRCRGQTMFVDRIFSSPLSLSLYTSLSLSSFSPFSLPSPLSLSLLRFPPLITFTFSFFAHSLSLFILTFVSISWKLKFVC